MKKYIVKEIPNNFIETINVKKYYLSYTKYLKVVARECEFYDSRKMDKSVYYAITIETIDRTGKVNKIEYDMSEYEFYKLSMSAEVKSSEYIRYLYTMNKMVYYVDKLMFDDKEILVLTDDYSICRSIEKGTPITDDEVYYKLYTEGKYE